MGCSPVSNPLALYETAIPQFTFDPAMFAALPASTPVWVRQIGSYARSPALLLVTLP